MEEITKAGIPGDDNGKNREGQGHEVNDLNLETCVQNESKETEVNDMDQKNETAEKEVEETDLSDDGEISHILSLSWEDIMFR